MIERLFVPRLDRLPSAAELKDPKTRLQEALQARGLPLPSYAVESTSGEAHNQLVPGALLGRRAGPAGRRRAAPSRRRAEQAAAQLILQRTDADVTR